MIGRVTHPFDRGRSGSLWPLFLWFVWIVWRLCFELDPSVSVCVLLGWRLTCGLVDWVVSWRNHLLLASVISDWHRASLRTKMKAKGIKFSPRPLPPPLLALPYKWLVFSCVMMSMWSVAMAGPVSLSPPVTWVTAFGSVRDLKHSFPPPPPAEPPDCFSVGPEPLTDGEGEEMSSVVVNQAKPQDSKDLDDLMALSFCKPCIAPAPTWNDFAEHATGWSAFVTSVVPSFGPLGLLTGLPSVQKPLADLHEAYVDSCASMTVTPFKEDFIEFEEVKGQVLKGISAGASIQGRGTIHWKVDVGNQTVDLKLRALYVPATEHRLLCPQQLRKEHKPTVKYCSVEETGISIGFQEGELFCPCNQANLPVLSLRAAKESTEQLQALNSCVTLENNQNLSVAQKELLKWHCRLGHVGFQRLQKIMRGGGLGQSPKIKAAAHLDLDKHPLKCGSCEFGKAKRKPSKRHKYDKETPEPIKQLSKEVLIPGQKVSMDHFIVSTPGRLFSSRGSDPFDRAYKGGVIFVDHATGFVFVELVVNFTAGEALRAKREFEREMSSMGVTVLNYHTDNGVFTAAEFQDELAQLGQDMTFSGVGAHHQNAVAERAIGTITAMARTMMLHAKIRWPKAVSTKLWPMALKHAQYLMNNVPSMNNVCPMDLILRTTVPRQHLRDVHVWGAPCFVLDPKLQDGGKVPKFEPRSRQGLHLGWSPKHASTVPLVLNLATGNISPQFHVVFDDWFTTVSSTAERDETEPIDGDTWTNLLLAGDRIQVGFDEDDPVAVDDEWLTEIERLEKHQKAAARVQGLPTAHSEPPVLGKAPIEPLQPAVPGHPTAPTPTAPLNQREPAPLNQREPLQLNQSPVTPAAAGIPQREQPSMKTRYRKAEIDESNILPQGQRRTRRPVLRGLFCSALLAMSNTPLMDMALKCVGSPAAQAAMAGYDAVTDTFDCVDFHSFQALTTQTRKMKKGQDPDYPLFEQVMRSPDAHEWKKAMDKEINTLVGMNTWTIVPRSKALAAGKKVIKVTWAFRQKRDPMGNPTKKKARLCVRGDTMIAGVDYGESFSPVVQWSSVRLMLILSIVHGLETRQVDYVNAFAQADLDREVFVEIPKGYEYPDAGVDCVLKLNKSLYGMSDAPLMFFELLKKNLLHVGFKQFTHIDPCLFVHKKAICLTYVDDCLWFGKDGAALDALINEMKGRMDLTVESNDVSNFLGIKFSRHGNTIELKQTGLINKLIEATGMQDANGKSTPAESKTLGKDPDGKPFTEQWNYASVVGMLLYLSGNSRPDIAFAVNQAARFTHDPKDSHAVAVKRIVRYLIHTKDKGLIFKPSLDWKVDCYVDADFCGLWGSEDPDDPIVAKSRTGYIILLAGCPLLWKSSLQTETSVSTMMAEYVALSSAMRDLLPLKTLVKTIAKVVTGDDNVTVTTKSDVFEDNNGALTVATMPRITPQSKFFAVKLHFFREHVKTEANPDGEIHIQKVETVNQLADIMTKGLVEDKYRPLRDRLMGWDLANAPT